MWLTQGAVSIAVTQLGTSRAAGYSTYQVAVAFDPAIVQDVYALYGEAGDALTIPPAWQAAAPFGSSIGPVNPAFVAVMPEAGFDSFVTIGMDGPALTQGALASVGVDFQQWSEDQGLSTENGAVFFMDPDHGADQEPVVFLQLTVRAGTRFSGQLSAQGRSVGPVGTQDWDQKAMRFTERGGEAPVPPPSPPKGSTTTPTQTDHCWLAPDYVATPCQNGGACTSSATSYVCTCARGFTGSNCETSSGPTPPPPPGGTADEQALLTLLRDGNTDKRELAGWLLRGGSGAACTQSFDDPNAGWRGVMCCTSYNVEGYPQIPAICNGVSTHATYRCDLWVCSERLLVFTGKFRQGNLLGLVQLRLGRVLLFNIHLSNGPIPFAALDF